MKRSLTDMSVAELLAWIEWSAKACTFSVKLLPRRPVRKRDAWLTEWEPDPRIVRLIAWALAGQPETEPLPEGAAEILASQRRADLFEACESVRAFGPSAAEEIRRSYGLPVELTRQPEGIATGVQAPLLSEGIAEMLLQEREWTEREWSTREDLSQYLFHRARNILWRRIRSEDRENRQIIARAALDAELEARPPALRRERMELLRDIEKSLAPVRRMMPKLDRHFRILSAAADPRTGELDLALVARRYGVSAARVEGFVHMIERDWKHELERLRLDLSLYVKRRPVRFDAASGKFEILPDDA
jgi:hypothetical protein